MTGPSGLVLVAGGVGASGFFTWMLQHAAARAGLPHTIRNVAWSHGFGKWHADLTDIGRHESGAAALVDEIDQYRAAHPAAPVYLVGKSGGCGIVVRALEQLPAEAIERVILLSPALSPDYDLAPALQAIRTQMVVFWSPLDVFVLGIGTRLFGTIDRVKCDSAGLVGFRLPPDSDPARRAAYGRLDQIRWRPAMARAGFLGDHYTSNLPTFLARYVIPLLGQGSRRQQPTP